MPLTSNSVPLGFVYCVISNIYISLNVPGPDTWFQHWYTFTKLTELIGDVWVLREVTGLMINPVGSAMLLFSAYLALFYVIVLGEPSLGWCHVLHLLHQLDIDRRCCKDVIIHFLDLWPRAQQQFAFCLKVSWGFWLIFLTCVPYLVSDL